MRVPDHLHEPIMAKLAAGWTQARVAAWLQRHHALTVTRQSIGRFARRVRQERGEVARAVARDKVAASVATDIDLADREIARLSELLDVAGAHARKHPSETKDYLALLDRLAPLLATRAKYSGVEESASAELQGLAELVGLAL